MARASLTPLAGKVATLLRTAAFQRLAETCNAGMWNLPMRAAVGREPWGEPHGGVKLGQVWQGRRQACWPGEGRRPPTDRFAMRVIKGTKRHSLMGCMR